MMVVPDDLRDKGCGILRVLRNISIRFRIEIKIPEPLLLRVFLGCAVRKYPQR